MIYRDTLLAAKKYRKLFNDLFDILEKDKITRYRVHKRTKIDQTRLCRVFNKKVPLSMNELIRICEEFSISIELKKDGTETSKPKNIVNYISKLLS